MLKDSPIQAYIPASNIIRARKFYEEVIGLQPRAEYAGGVVYECGGVSVFMYPTPNAGTSEGQPSILAGKRRRSRGRRTEGARCKV